MSCEHDNLEKEKIIKNDKKVKLGDVHFILLNDIGSTVIKNDIDDATIIKVIESL